MKTTVSDDTAYIQWGDVTISEENESLDGFNDETIFISSTWIAEFEGHICNTALDGITSLPIIRFSRTGISAEDAAQKFVKAAKDQGWEVR